MRFVVRVDDLDKVAGAGHDMFWQEPLPEEYAAPAAKDSALAKGLSTLRRNLLGEPVAEAHGLQHTDSGIGVVHTALAFAVYMTELRQLEAGQDSIVATLEPVSRPLPARSCSGKGDTGDGPRRHADDFGCGAGAA